MAASLLVGGWARPQHAQLAQWAHGPWSHATRATTTTGTADPAQNVPPSPDYWPTCSSEGTSSAACTDAVVAAINNARAAEGVKAMTLPSGFAQMSPAVQTFVVSNLERVDRGLAPAAGMVGTLNSAAQTAADNDADPTLASWTIGSFSANRWGSIWAGDLNALAADYDWMYNDGWSPTGGSINLDCTTATASGCWGHRDNILSTYGGEEVITGVASTQQSQWLSIAQIFVAGSGSYPAFTTAWSDASGAAPSPTTTDTSSTPTTTNAPVATSTPTSPSVDVTVSKLAASASVVWAGHSVTLTGLVLDATTALPVANAPVQLCAVTRYSTPSCSSMTTDANGTVVGVARPTRRTTYWLSFAGSDTLAPSTSPMRAVQVRATGRLHSGHVNGHLLIDASLTPARGQSVRLQRLTSHGWVAVRLTSASRALLVFSRLPQGVYRMVISAGLDVLGSTTATLRG